MGVEWSGTRQRIAASSNAVGRTQSNLTAANRWQQLRLGAAWLEREVSKCANSCSGHREAPGRPNLPIWVIAFLVGRVSGVYVTTKVL